MQTTSPRRSIPGCKGDRVRLHGATGVLDGRDCVESPNFTVLADCHWDLALQSSGPLSARSVVQGSPSSVGQPAEPRLSMAPSVPRVSMLTTNAYRRLHRPYHCGTDSPGQRCQPCPECDSPMKFEKRRGGLCRAEISRKAEGAGERVVVDNRHRGCWQKRHGHGPEPPLDEG